VYAIDPATGRLAWKTRVGRGSAIGGVHFGMAAEGGRLFVPISDRIKAGPAGDPFPQAPGLYALDIGTGQFAWKAPSPDTCNGKPLCTPGYGGSLTTTAGLLLAGADDGFLRIYDATTGKLAWETNTARDFTTINGVPAHGGSISGGVAPLAYKGSLIVPSGYGFAMKMGGNVLLVYQAE
jgi:polyvinyl alcohol dehydrogenase (cytochrome)